MKKLLLLAVSLLATLFIGGSQAMAQETFCDTASPRPAICGEIDQGGTGTNNDNPATRILRSAINIISYVVGVASVVMVMVGSFKYIVSGGDANAVASAKNTVIYALVGLAIALLSQAIVRFVLSKV